MRPYLHTLIKTIGNPSHIIFLIVGMISFAVVAVLVSNYQLLMSVATAPTLNREEMLIFLATLFSGPVETYGTDNLIFFLVLDFLFVLNLAVMYRLFKEQFFLPGRGLAPATTAFLVAVLGLGCFSCGSVLLFFFLSVFGVTFSSVVIGAKLWILLLSMLLFIVSIAISLKKLATPPVC